jgi:hypothetical protein
MKREMISIQTKIAGNVDVDDEPINGLAPRRWTTPSSNQLCLIARGIHGDRTQEDHTLRPYVETVAAASLTAPGVWATYLPSVS